MSTSDGRGEDPLREVEAMIRLAEWQDKRVRQQTRRRRLKKAGLIALVPIAGPLIGDLWAENDRKGWR